jgi:hypothetical protein
LRQIEDRVLPSALVPGPNGHATLPEYYWAENQQLLARFDEAKRALAESPQPHHRSVTLVAGAAGLGKTFLKGEVYRDIALKEAVCKIDIHDLYDLWATRGLVLQRPDVVCDGLAVSHCTSSRKRRDHLVWNYLEAQEACIFVIDSLDEIHPEDCVWVLEQVQQFVLKTKRNFVSVTVFGRSHAFRDFWQSLGDRGQKTNTRLFLLNPPVFRTTGDLLVSTWNYHTWRYDLKWSPRGGEPESMSLEAYRDWRAKGFSRTGKFRSVTCRANNDMRSDVQACLVDCAQRQPVVYSVLHNLAGNGMIREILQNEFLAGKSFNEQEVMRAYLDHWLTRETQANGTPSVGEPTHLELYLKVLGQLALEYADSVDSQGFFTIHDGDQVVVSHSGRQMTFDAETVLNRSGMILLDPRKEGEERIRFEPFWLHRMLAEPHYRHPAHD